MRDYGVLLSVFLAASFMPSFFSRIFAAGASPGLKVIKTETLFEKAPFRQCHASTIAESKEGLVAAWFAGTEERNPDVGIWVSRREKDGWTEPREVANGIQSPEKRFPCWNPVLFQAKSGSLLLFYKVGPSPRSWWGMVMRSEDGGVTWSIPRKLPEGVIGPVKNKPIELGDGGMLCPSSSEDHGWRVHFERSDDGGETWKSTGPLNNGRDIAAIQPSILVHGDHRLQAIGRTEQKKVFSIESLDDGRTWGPMTLLELPNPCSGTDAVTLKDGRHLIVYNHSTRFRSPLNVGMSQDGKTWMPVVTLESSPGEFSYPAVIQGRDGLVHITYTWERKRIKHVVCDPGG